MEPISAAAMTATIERIAAAARPSGGTTPGAAEGAGQSFRDALSSVSRSEQVVDRAVRRAARGADLTPAELLSVQHAVYRASQRAELVAKAVDKVSDSVREITQIRI